MEDRGLESEWHLQLGQKTDAEDGDPEYQSLSCVRRALSGERNAARWRQSGVLVLGRGWGPQ